jgi:transaldolase/glucose-6-phosphate isomerase
MNAIKKLNKVGQSLWYDNIQRSLLENGGLQKFISDGEIMGVTSNPSIFHDAISRSTDYDSALTPMAWAGWTTEQIFDQLAVEDIRAAADLFRPLYESTGARDGYVSLEVSPYLSNDTQDTLSEARRLWNLVNRPNLMIKIPATPEGIPAVREAIAEGINVNITLIFSQQRYAEVMEAYLTGLERRSAAGLPVNHIASVASFFVSRVDSKIDAKLNDIVGASGAQAELAQSLLGRAAIANARLAYAKFKEVFSSKRFLALQAKGARVQRPLWASTSTKNPAYRDVMYVEELIGKDTVNTVPPQTLDAFRDHGEVRLSLEENLDQARLQLSNLENLGISLDQATQELEQEGVKSFSDAFTALLKTVEERRKAAQTELGSLQQGVTAQVQEFDRNHFSKRLHAHDASLWTTDPAGQAEIKIRMGWLDVGKTGRAIIPDLMDFARELVNEGFTRALLLGMGGSSLAPEVMRAVCGVGDVGDKPGLDLMILDSTDPGQVKQAADQCPTRETVYIVSSKSGGTSEVNAYLEYFWAKARQELGQEANQHFIAITDPGTALDRMARDRGFRKVFNADPNVGGRNSALTAFGLVPAGLMGQDVERILDRADWMAAQCAEDVPAGRNPGLVLGAIIGQAALNGRDKVIFLADALWQPVGPWMEQLIAESSGKQGKGILPVESEPLQPVEWYSNDRLFVYLKADGQHAGMAGALRQAGHPVLTIESSDRYNLGAEFYRWEVATAVACSMIGVNSFDQPDVQDNKNRTSRKVMAFRDTGALDEGLPIWSNDAAKVFGKPFNGMDDVRTLPDLVKKFLNQAKSGDYVAINAYLPRNPVMLEQLQAIRWRIQELTGRPTTLGFGPRFLHSTGQLHKGGPNNGVFLQITADPVTDQVIPGQGMTFGTLERAQALGDLEALLARERRAIRVHLLNGLVGSLVD